MTRDSKPITLQALSARSQLTLVDVILCHEGTARQGVENPNSGRPKQESTTLCLPGKQSLTGA
jgi:hypothetical protein